MKQATQMRTYWEIPGLENIEIEQQIYLNIHKRESVESLLDYTIEFCNENRPALGIGGKTLTKEDVLSKKRNRELVTVRHIFSFAVKRLYPNMTLKNIGNYLGGKDHATIIHSIKLIDDLMDSNRRFRNVMMRYLRQI